MAKYEVRGYIKGLKHTEMVMDAIILDEQRAKNLCITMMNVYPNKVYYYKKVI